MYSVVVTTGEYITTLFSTYQCVHLNDLEHSRNMSTFCRRLGSPIKNGQVKMCPYEIVILSYLSLMLMKLQHYSTYH